MKGCGVMPKERVRKAGREGFADLLVQWGRDEIGTDEQYQEFDQRPRVRLFVIAAELGIPGSFAFHPEPGPDAHPDTIGAHGEAIGPVDIMLDRQQVNRLIRVLRRARDQAYGRDE